jgi:hypothetical protein
MARPFSTTLFALADDGLLVVNPGLAAAAIVDPVAVEVSSSARLAGGPGFASGLLSTWTADTDGSYLYVADTSGAQGGIWVYEVPSLQLVDRWLSTTPFAALQVSSAGVIFAIGQDQPILFVLNADGAIQAATELAAPPTRLF